MATHGKPMKWMRDKSIQLDDAKAAGIVDAEETGKIAGASAGALAGAAVGAFAGPVGLVAGGVIGAAAGAAAGIVYADAEAERAHVEEELDKDIGVISGSIGAADPSAPPSKRGVFSGSSAGGGSTGGGDTNIGISPDEGPIPKAD